MHEILKKLFASGFSFGLIVPMLAILLATTSPVVASGDDCSVPLDVGFDSSVAEVVEVDENPWNWWGQQPNQNTDLLPLTEDLYVEIDLQRNYAQAVRLELVTGYSYTFCVEFNSDPDNPPTDDPKGDVYLFDSANWRRYQDEYEMTSEGWETPEEVIDMIPVEWRDMVVFLPFRDAHAYEEKEMLTVPPDSVANVASVVDGDMIVQVWVEVEERLTLPKFTAYVIVGLLPLSCVIVPILMHSRYHASGTEESQEKQELVPLLEQ